MPFEILKQKFGDLTEYIVQESTSGNRFVVVPELGGIIRQLSLRKGVTLYSLLKTPATPNLLREDTQSASELLFPFASRIPEGKYQFLGKKYQLDRNEAATNHAIHGLIRKQNFEVEEQFINTERADIRLSFSLKESEGYPFNIHFTVKYALSVDGRFTLSYEATNTGLDPCPVMFGWHPYFQLGNEMGDAWKINIPSDRVVDFDENMIPVGSMPLTESFPMPLYRKTLDTCFLVKNTKGRAITELISENQAVTLSVEQETGEGKFNYLVVYTPPMKDCIAIEPLTGNVNCFNNGEGLNILAPENKISGSITVDLY